MRTPTPAASSIFMHRKSLKKAGALAPALN